MLRADVNTTYSTPFIETPDVLSFKLGDIVDSMIAFWDKAGQPVNWLSETGNLEHSLQSLLATSDCCLSDKSMKSIMRMQLLSDTSIEGYPVVISNLVWNPPVIQFEGLQTNLLKGSSLSFKPSCIFSRDQCSHSSIQYHIQMDSNWLYWNSDMNMFEGVVPIRPNKFAWNDCYETSFIVVAVINTSFPEGVIFERNVRCQTRLKIMKAGDINTRRGYDKGAAQKFDAFSATGRALGHIKKVNNLGNVYPEKSYDQHCRPEKIWRPFPDSRFYSSELLHCPEPLNRACDISAILCEKRKELHGSSINTFPDQESHFLLRDSGSAKRESSNIEFQDQGMHQSALLKRKGYDGNNGSPFCNTEPSMRTSKRARCSKNTSIFSSGHCEQRNNFYQ